MVRISDYKIEAVKRILLQEFEKNKFLTTNQLANIVGRSWTFTEQMLSKLLADGKIEMFQINQAKAWRIKSG